MLMKLILAFAVQHHIGYCGPLTDDRHSDESPRLALGSEPAKITEAKYVVAMTYSAKSPHKMTNFFCTGTILHAEWVLTAAHCLEIVKDRPSVYAVVAGADEKDQISRESSKVQVRNVLTVIMHPDYWAGRVSKYDVGVVQVERFDFNERVGPAKVWAEVWPYEKDKKARVEYGTLDCSAFGWGAMEIRSEGAEKLGKLNMSASHGTKACSCFQMFIQRRLVCSTKSSPSGLCPGDSGGPLVCQGKIAGVAHLIFDKRGCSSFHIGSVKLQCNSPHTVSTWMYVCPMLDFISEHVPDVPKKPESCRGSLLSPEVSLSISAAIVLGIFTRNL